MNLSGSSDAAGLSAFGTGDDMSMEDDAGATRVGDGMDDDLTLESVGSGSGLLDLTRESDDTTLGAELLEDAFNSDDDNFEIPANASGLFEAAGVDETESGGAPAIGDGGAARRHGRGAGCDGSRAHLRERLWREALGPSVRFPELL